MFGSRPGRETRVWDGLERCRERGVLLVAGVRQSGKREQRGKISVRWAVGGGRPKDGGMDRVGAVCAAGCRDPGRRHVGLGDALDAGDEAVVDIQDCRLWALWTLERWAMDDGS